MKKYKTPTGFLFVDDYDKGQLETLSIGDYGKSQNIKADFLGHSREIHGVPNQPIMPLQEKWVITISTQYGCVMKCNFCDVPKVSWKGNATYADLQKQFMSALTMFPEVKYTDRLNLHFARMGEPIFNKNVIDFAVDLYSAKKWYQDETGVRIETLHPVLTTSLPKSYSKLKTRVRQWVYVKNEVYRGQAGLQFSINTTDEDKRNEMFGNMSLSLLEISELAKEMEKPLGRKYCLNFAYDPRNEIDAKLLKKLFNPDDWMIKITPIHNTQECRNNGIETELGYESYTPYRNVERDLINEGFDVIVFIPSKDEEEHLITCGNAILSK